MLETTTLSIGELAERWKQPARQILDAAVSLQIPVYGLFNGLAFPLTDDHWLREGGDGQKRHELETMKRIIEDSEARITRCRMGEASEFDAMTPEEIIELRAQINKMQAECQAITDALELRRKDRLKREYIGLIRLPPRIIFNVLKGEKDVRMDMGLHPGYPVEVKPNPRIAGQSIADGALMWLEPAARVTLEHLVVLTEHTKTIEANKAASVALLPVDNVQLGHKVPIHSTKARRDVLRPVIEQAQSQCINANDTAEVWAKLQLLAEEKTPPLIGATEDGLQYLKKGAAANFTRNALRQRLGRSC